MPLFKLALLPDFILKFQANSQLNCNDVGGGVPANKK